jgi:hypothetical protein
MARQFRFGVNFLESAPAEEWARKCRHAEALGYDVLLVPDHLGWPAPFPSLVAAAQATQRPRVGTFVLNAAFWNPVLLAREVATTDQLTGGRLELGLGAGYAAQQLGADRRAHGDQRKERDKAGEGDGGGEPGPVDRGQTFERPPHVRTHQPCDAASSAVWRDWAHDLRGGPVESGHHIAEESPGEPIRALLGCWRANWPPAAG